MTVVIALAGIAEQLDALLTRCFVWTRNGRFFGPAQRWPSAYRTGMVAADPSRHDAVVTRVPTLDCIVGVASVVAGPDLPALAALVEDRWQLRVTVLPGSSRPLVLLGGALTWEPSETIGHVLSGVCRL